MIESAYLCVILNVKDEKWPFILVKSKMAMALPESRQTF